MKRRILAILLTCVLAFDGAYALAAEYDSSVDGTIVVDSVVVEPEAPDDIVPGVGLEDSSLSLDEQSVLDMGIPEGGESDDLSVETSAESVDDLQAGGGHSASADRG